MAYILSVETQPISLPFSHLAVLDAGLVHGGVAAVRDHTLHLLQLVVLVPHLTSVTDHVGHGGVNDDIAGDVEVGDAVVGVDHGQSRPGLVLLHDVGLHFLLLGMSLDFVVDVSDS